MQQAGAHACKTILATLHSQNMQATCCSMLMISEAMAAAAPVASVLSMPRAAHATPNMPAREKLVKMATAITKQGTMADW